MSDKLFVASAGNTLAPALAVLRSRGFHVSALKPTNAGERLFEAENDTCRLVAEDTVSLLGLATIVHQRGADWRPTDAEVDDFLRLNGDDAA